MFVTIGALLAQQPGAQPPVILKATTRLVQVSVIAQDNYTKFLKNGFVYSKVVNRADRAKLLRIVVRDAASGAIGSVTVPLAKIS